MSERRCRYIVLLLVTVLLVGGTRLVAAGASRELLTNDRYLLRTDRLGVTGRNRVAYQEAMRTVGYVIDPVTNVKLGTGVVLGPVLEFAPPDRHVPGFAEFTWETPPPPRQLQFREENCPMAEDYVTWQMVRHTVLVATSVEAIPTRESDDLAFGFFGRAWFAKFLESDPETGVAILMVVLHTGDNSCAARFPEPRGAAPMHFDSAAARRGGELFFWRGSDRYSFLPVHNLDDETSPWVLLSPKSTELAVPAYADLDGGKSGGLAGLLTENGQSGRTVFVSAEQVDRFARLVAAAYTRRSDLAPSMGVRFACWSPAHADAAVLPQGCTVTEIVEGGVDSPLAVGDIIVGFDGVPVTTWVDVLGPLQRHEPGDRVDVAVVRGPSRITISLTLPAAGTGS